MKPLE